MKLKINKMSFFYTLFLLPNFIPSFITSSLLIMIIRIIGLVSFCFLFAKTISTKRGKNIIDFLIIAVSSWLIIISSISKTISVEILYLIYSWFSTCYIGYHSLENKSNTFFKVFCYILNVAVLINIPFLINGIGTDEYLRIYIFGGKNSIQMFFLPAIFCNYALSSIKYNSIKPIYAFFIILDVLSIFLSESSTGIITVSLFLAFILFSKHIMLNFKQYISAFLVALFFVFNTKVIENIPFFYNFIVNFLHKDLTFTARTKVWEWVFKFIPDNLFGYGYGNNIVNMQFPRLNECHNIVLELLIIGGIPLLILIAVLLYKFLNKNINKLTNALLLICSSYFIIGLTESVQFHIQFWVIFIMYYGISRNQCTLLNKKGSKNE